MPTLAGSRPWARAGLFAGLSLAAYVTLSLPAVRERVLVPWTDFLASAARGLLAGLGFDAGGSAHIVSVDSFAVAVLDVCNGSDVFVLFACAVVAAPARWWPDRVAALALGLPALAGLNLVRVVALVLTGRYLPSIFEISHQFLWQLLLVLATAGLFVVWLRRIPGPRDA